MQTAQWQRDIGRRVTPGAERLVVKAIARISERGITHLTRQEYLLIQELTDMSSEAVNALLESLQEEGWLRLWRPDKPSMREGDELIIQLIQ